MELDDLKNTWNGINHRAEQQQNLTSKSIDQMTQEKYHSKLKKIAYPEIAGIIICLAGAVYIGVNFYKLDTTFFKGVGIVSILVLSILSIISFVSIRKFNIAGDMNRPYTETLKIFALQKVQFYKLQQVNVTLSYLLLLTVIILLTKFFKGIDITANKYFWIFSFSFGYIFLLFYSGWVSKFYKKTLVQAEELLKELQQ